MNRRSAGWQPAVSPTVSRQRSRITNPRYSRLPVGATRQRRFMVTMRDHRIVEALHEPRVHENHFGVRRQAERDAAFAQPMIASRRTKAPSALRSALLLTRIVESWFGFVAGRRPRVAVGFSPRWRTKRVGVAERRLNGWQMRAFKRRSATRILASGNRGLKPTATVIQSLRDTGHMRSV